MIIIIPVFRRTKIESILSVQLKAITVFTQHYVTTTAQTTVNTQHTELLNTLKDKSDCTRRVATALLPGSVKLFEILYDQLW
jgi:hypothetical protein